MTKWMGGEGMGWEGKQQKTNQKKKENIRQRNVAKLREGYFADHARKDYSGAET